MRGGGGFEIWQFTSRTPIAPAAPPKAGDTGIFAIKIKAPDALQAQQHFAGFPRVQVTPVYQNPEGTAYFWLTDPYGNLFQIIETVEWFQHNSNICGGVCGAVIGVSNVDRALAFYSGVLGISNMIGQYSGPATDIPGEENGTALFNRVVLRKPQALRGAFSKLLGSVEIELISCINRQPNKIFHNRYWGDCGFIHLCFDVLHMCTLKELAASAGYSFTVDSADSFTMGDSAGRFCYVEDPDGTLIELVETHKVPVLKKAGWYINLQKRKDQQPLPDWMIRLLALKKVS
jgi:catechol 2,3-dioxygenase-like lactoylglutathione lyase family enzyme